MAFLEFFKRQVLLAHVSGIPIRIDYRWFFVFVLMSWIMSGQLVAGKLTDNALTGFIFGLLTTLVLFASILFHELAHAFVARWERVDVLEIVIHPFGGLARLRREPDTPRAEFRIAIAGPVASFLLALFFLGLMTLFSRFGTNILTPLCFILALLNFLLAVFNLFPGYPLDGGRVLRALLWRRGKDLNEATVLTGRFGQIIGVVMISFGLFVVLIQGDFPNGFWTILVGLFLYDAAKSIIREINDFETLSVEEVMMLPVPIEPDENVLRFVDNVLPFHRQTIFPVSKNRQLYGVLLLEDLKTLPRDEWHKTKIVTVMRPVTPDYFVESTAPLAEARELMRVNGIGALGIIDARGNLVGFLQRGKIRRRS
ncbi:MAG TPA: site-2 protease family protein [Pyrinomonadaceae bacterium]|jgi:Zn-dependent protease